MPATLLRFTLRVLGTSSSALQAELERLFTENGGAIPFERFMQEALYHPEFGYYTHHIRTVGGARGDFATSATLSGLLGMAIAQWIQNEVRFLPPGRPIDVIEIGGGEGSLMREVIQALRGPTSPLTRWWRRSPKGFRFHLVEISPRLRERQRDTLKPWRGAIQWHNQIESALMAARGNALMFSNELVDAFPAVALQKPHSPEADDWSEVCVSFDSRTGIREELRPLRESRPELDRSAFSILPHLASLPPGQRVELHDSYRRWWESWAPMLRSGSLLTIDYGATDPLDLYRRRPEGTLRAYYRHVRLNGPGLYRMFGRQDLTADVSFSDLSRWGKAFGFGTTVDLSQADFLRQFASSETASMASTERAAAFLLSPDGAGEAFRVLAQRKISH